MRIWGNWLLCGIIVWVAGIIGLAIEGYLKPRGRTVFDIYAVASRAWFDGQDLYPRQAETHELYRYSPVFAVVTAPLALTHPGVGNGLWKAINGIVFLVGLLHWSRKSLPFEPLSPNQRGIVLLLAAPVAMMSLHIGQANLMMAGLLLFTMSYLQEQRYWLAGLFLAAATLIKVIPLALALVLFFLTWRIIIPYFTALLVGLVLPFAFQNSEYVLRQTESWLRHLIESNDLNRERLRSLDKLFELAGYPIHSKLMLCIAAIAGGLVLLVGVVSYLRTADSRLTLWLVLAWFLNWILLFSPATETVTYSIIAPVIAVALLWSWRTPGAWISRMVLVISLILMGPMNTDLSKPLRQWIDTPATPIVGALLFQFWLVAHTAKLIARRQALDKQ